MSYAHTAVLLLAHGTPNALGEVPEYLRRVTGGRELSPQVVAELQHRYAQIGLGDQPNLERFAKWCEPGQRKKNAGILRFAQNDNSTLVNSHTGYALVGDQQHLGDSASEQLPPLTRWTQAQARQLQSALADAGRPMPVYFAMRNWHPLIADVVRRMRDAGVTRILALCLAPQSSSASTGLYRRDLMAAVEDASAQIPSAANLAQKLSVDFVESWSQQPALIDAFAQRLVALYSKACADTVTSAAAAGEAAALPVLFTAHSVPCRTILSPAPAQTSGLPQEEASGKSGGGERTDASASDSYPVQAKRTAALVYAAAARQLPELGPWFFAFQSQGVSAGPWLGPSVEETLSALRRQGYTAVLLQPIGFLSDHVEILYDIDIAFAKYARQIGLRLLRSESLNDSALLTEALLHVVQSRIHA